jgi:hypothetical protein
MTSHERSYGQGHGVTQTVATDSLLNIVHVYSLHVWSSERPVLVLRARRKSRVAIVSPSGTTTEVVLTHWYDHSVGRHEAEVIRFGKTLTNVIDQCAQLPTTRNDPGHGCAEIDQLADRNATTRPR